MRSLRIRSKLLISFILLSVVTTGIVTYTVYSEMRPHFLEAVEVTLIDASRLLASQLAIEAEGNPQGVLQIQNVRKATERFLATDFPQRNYYDRINRSPLRIYVTDARGIVVFDSNRGELEGQDFSRWRDVHLTLRGQYGARATRLDPNDPRTSTHFVAAPIRIGQRIAGVVSIGKPVESVSGFIRYSNLKIGLTFVVTLAAALLLSACAAHWISRPVLQLEDYVRSVRCTQPIPFPKLSADEIGALGRAFEALRKELEGKQYVERYVHNLTHEIKSPLTGIVGAAELLAGDSLSAPDRTQLLSNIQTEASRLQDIAEKLLELASLEAREKTVRREEFDLRLLAEEVLESFELQAQKHGIALALKAADTLVVDGERFLIWRAVSNLVQNAIDFAPTGTTVELTARLVGDCASVEIRDFGSGVPEFAIERLSEKFFSLERPRTGKRARALA